MNGIKAESPLWLPEELKDVEMMHAVRSLSELIKSLSIGRKDTLFDKTRYLTEYDVDGRKFRLVYYPKVEKTEEQEERPEEFILVKRSALDLTDEIDYGGVLNYGFILRITNDIQDQEKQNISNIQTFPNNIKDIVSENETNLKFQPLIDEWIHLLMHSTTEPGEVLPETKYYPKTTFINGLIKELSQIPLLA